MSYEGYEQFICEDGHYTVMGPHYFDIPACDCGKRMKWNCSVDITNGFEEDAPWSKPGIFEEVDWIDQWKVDHYGNRYAEQTCLYIPINKEGENEWRLLKGFES